MQENKQPKPAKKGAHDPSVDCIFCKIVRGEIPARIVCENEKCLAFMDVNPNSDGHVLVIPKKHSRSFLTTDPEDLKEVIVMTQAVAKIISASKLDPWGFNYVSNQESIASQAVFHFHMHIIPKYAVGEGYTYSIGRKNLRPLAEVYELIKAATSKIKRK